MQQGWLRLSRTEFDVLWELLEYGEHPYPLDVESVGTTEAERMSLRHKVIAELTTRGLLHDGQPTQRLAGMLELLAHGRISVDAQLMVDGFKQILAAGRGPAGVFAMLDGDELRMVEIRGTGLVSAVLEVIPQTRSASGDQVQLPADVFADAVAAFADGGHFAFENTLATGGVTGRGVRTLSVIIESERSAGGQLAANAFDRTGSRRRSPVLNFFDTADGRYLVSAHSGQDRRRWLTFAPGDSARIARSLQDMLDDVSR